MGELDSLNILGAPHADPVTGAAHSCGHNAQIAEMLGVAIGLHASGVMSQLSGQVTFMAIPAEEYVEIEYRNGLRQQGKIEFLGGKQEFIRLGEFDNVDAAMMVHLSNRAEGKPSIKVGGTSNGSLVRVAHLCPQSPRVLRDWRRGASPFWIYRYAGRPASRPRRASAAWM